MASIKVSDLQATTSAAAESFLYLADTSNGGVEFDSKKITVANFLGAYATEAFVNSAISDLINGAPEALDTLKEISDAIGDSGDIVGNLIGMIEANESHVDNMATLTGVLKDAADLGSFTGSTIADSATIKSALQALETSLETKGSASALNTVTSNTNDLIALTGLSAGSIDLGEFSGSTLSDNATLKTVLQDAETKMELIASELDTEEAARAAADALLLPKAGGVMTGNLDFGQASAVNPTIVKANPDSAISGETINGLQVIADSSQFGWMTVAAENARKLGADGGKHYYEIKINSGTIFAGVAGGVATPQELTFNTSGYETIHSVTANGARNKHNGGKIRGIGGSKDNNVTFGDGDVLGIALDLDPQFKHIYFTVNGVAAGDANIFSTPILTDFFPALSMGAGADIEFRFQADDLEYLPTDSTAWVVGASAATITPAGVATFSGSVSSPAVPTSPDHLVNKAYLDSLDNENDAQVQANTLLINTEIADRQAADALLLPLAGGNMSGSIEMGEGQQAYVSNVSVTAGAFYNPTSLFDDDGFGLPILGSTLQMSGGIGPNFVSFSPIQVNTSLRIYTSAELDRFEIKLNQNGTTIDTGVQGVAPDNNTFDWLDIPVNAPFELTAIGNEGSGRWFKIGAIEVDGEPIVEGKLMGSAPLSTIGVDGTATFGGLVSAATAPTADEHLVNKLYADNLVAGVDLTGIAINAGAIAQEITDRTNADNTLQVNIDAEEAARISADNTLTVNLAQEVSDRTAADSTLQSNIDAEEAARIAADDAEAAARAAADALLLPLAGGTMSGAIEFGSAPGGAYTANPQAQAGSTRGDGSEPFDGLLTERFELEPADGIPAVLRFNPITVNTSLRIYAALWTSSEIKLNRVFNGESQDVPVVDTGVMGTNATYEERFNKQWYDIAVTTPFELTSIGHDSPVNHAGNYYAIEVDGVIVEDGVTTFSTAAATTIGVDGTASFSGLISAPTAPTADEHLANKLYVDSTAASNAAAIEALTNGAPELLNTLNELAQAINDDENFSTTVTNLVASETAARTAADTTLQSNIDAEEAARIAADNTLTSGLAQEVSDRQAADALLLPLAGGTMSGDINFGGVAETTGAYVSNVVTGDGSDFGPNLFVDGSSLKLRSGSPTTFTPIVAQSSVKISTYGVYPQYANDFQIRVNGVAIGSAFTGAGIGYRAVLNLTGVTFPFTISSISVDGVNNDPNKYAWIEHIEIDGVPVYEGTVVTMAGEVSAAQLKADGSANFAGLISAATAPTADEHLVNKAYSDASVAQEVADRQAADALLLPLAGGTMSGAIQLGAGSAAPGFIAADAPTTVSGTTFISSHDSWRMMHLDEFKSSGKQYIEFTVDSLTSGPITLGVVEENNLDTVSKRRSELGRTGTAIGWKSAGTLWVATTETAWGFIPAPVFGLGDVIGVLLDMDARTVQFSKNGTLINKVVNLPGTGAYTFASSIYSYSGTTEVTYQLSTVANLPTGYEIISAGGPASTLNIDGTATFVGSVTAATAPTSDAHLANKQYVDGKHASSVSGLNQEIADRQAGDAVLQANIDAEAAARAAADAQLLQLTGGSMAGPIDFGGVTQINPDGSADFSGLISADSVPTLPQHLTNKLYVDTQVAVNAAAIEAVVGGAPELLNTLNELAEAIGDDENFATTITNAIAAETSARTTADTTLQTNIDTESAARVAADNLLTVNLNTEIADRQAADAAEAAARAAADSLLLPLAGGTMSGAIQMGVAGTQYVSNISAANAGGAQGNSLLSVFDGTGQTTDQFGMFRFASAGFAHYVSFEPLEVTTSLRVWVDTSTTGVDLNVETDNPIQTGRSNGGAMEAEAAWVNIPVSAPFTLTSIGRSAGYNSWFYLGGIEVDGVVITEGMMLGGSGNVSTLGVDGTATFSGLVSASTAPTADEHLTNKLYVDGKAASNLAGLTQEIADRTAADTTLQVNIDAEAAARASADNTLTINLAQEVSDRQAADALLLPLAGGTMSGAIELGQSGGPTLTIESVNGGIRSITFDLDASGTGNDSGENSVIDVQSGGFVDVQQSNTGYNAWSSVSRNSTAQGYQTSRRYLRFSFTTATYEITLRQLRSTETYAPYTTSSDAYASINDATNGSGQLSLTATASSVLGVDGTASFGGLVSAATAPTAPEHLTNKAYVDSTAASNAAAIEAVVGGAPELLNTLNELAQAISDDENFSTTVTNLIASETSARTAADTTLQVNIDAEAAARAAADATLTSDLAQEVSDRQAADALLLPLAGGTMSGAINLGSAGPGTVTLVTKFDADTNILNRGTVSGDGLTVTTTGSRWDGGIVEDGMSANTGTYYFEFTSTEKYVLWGLSASNNNASLDQTGDIKVFPTLVNQVKVSNELVGDTFDLIEDLTPADVKGLSYDSATGLVIFYVNGVEFTRYTLDNSLVYKFGAITRNWEEGTESIYLVTDPALQTYAPLGSGNGSVLGVDGTASFGGLISAATAPTADAHLTNKLYVDALAATNASGLTQEIADRQAADAAESAARIAADNTLTTNLAQEVSDRQAGDATLTTNLAQEIADRIAAVAALTNGAVADNTAAIAQETADRVAADALKVDKQSLVNEHMLGQTSAQSVPVDAEGNSNYLFLVVDKATGALKSIDKTFLEAE